MSTIISKQWPRSLLSVCVSLCFLTELTFVQADTGKPVKLAVQSQTLTVERGSRAEITIVLQNTNNQAVKAAKEYEVELEVRQPSRRRDNQKVKIKVGETSVKQQIQFNEIGLVEIRARHGEMREGGLFINVKSPAALRIRPIPRQTPTPKTTPRPRSGAATTDTTPLFSATDMMFRFTSSTPGSQPFSWVKTQAPPPVQDSKQSLSHPILSLVCSDRKFLADGKDKARVQAFLNSRFLSDIRIRLSSNNGKLDPEVLLIPSGQDSADSFLTCEQVGEVTVRFQSSNPEVELQGSREMKIRFVPPITKLDIDSSPPKILQVDKTDLIIRLKGENNLPLATDEERQISIAVVSGRGEVEPKYLSIQPGQSEQRASFSPTSTGKVTVSATSPNLPLDSDDIEVESALVLLIWSVIGGAAGGLVAYLTQKGLKWWMRVTVGIITGLVLYWGFLFAVLSFFPRTTVIISFSAFVISVIGGWAGTGVFSLFLKKFNLFSGNGTGEVSG
jgi:hypothetical protein